MSKRKRDINSPNNEQPLRGLRILFLVRTPQERIRVTRVLSRRLEELGASLVGSVENLQSWTRSEVASVVVCTDDISHAKTCCNPLPLSAFEGVVDVSWAAGCVQNRQVATIRLLNVSEATQTSIDDCDGGSRGVIDDALDGDDQQETMEAAKWWPPRNLRPRRYLQPSSDMDCEEEASTRQDRIEAAKNIPKYACQRKSHLEACPNERLCEYLNAMADLRAMESHDSRLGDTKYRAYRLASAAIRCFPFRIRSAEEAEYIPYCGGRVKEAIHEYLQTGKLSEVSKLWTEEYFINLWSLLGVHGIGTKTGRELLASGVTSLDLVVQHCLSGKHPSLKLPLVFYNDLNHNLMSRDDAVRIHDYVINVASSLGLSLEFALAGGFRRNKKNGHDVDLLMRHKYLEFGHSSELQVLVRALRASGFIVATFHETIDQRRDRTASPGTFDGPHDMVFCVIRDPQTAVGRRLDLVASRRSEFPFALLAWSGNAIFERQLREYAKEVKGWVFDGHGLWKKENPSECATGTMDTMIETEKDIFCILGLDYLDPSDRNC